MRNRKNNLCFRWHGWPFSQREPDSRDRRVIRKFDGIKNVVFDCNKNFVHALWAEMFSFTTHKAMRYLLPLFLPMRSEIGNKHIS